MVQAFFDAVAWVNNPDMVEKPDVVREYLANGGDVNVRRENGETALFSAAMDGSSEMVQLLLGAGGHVNVLSYDSSESPLQSAYTEAYLLYEEVNREAVACMEYLEAHGGKWNLVLDCEDMPELSPLNYRFLRAVVQEDTEAVYAALAEGANVNVRGRNGVSALVQAVRMITWRLHAHCSATNRMQRACRLLWIRRNVMTAGGHLQHCCSIGLPHGGRGESSLRVNKKGCNSGRMVYTTRACLPSRN